ncbi:MAG TPA: cation:proton antiporter [Candidatus Nanoarchaeia archaeon]|nr:cation:proton antiporter [Candidatus Nanoarchaeia archaeon]
MPEILSIFTIVSVILFFGLLAEFIFKKINVPDILLLVGMGFLLGPFGLNFISLENIQPFAPIFTTFALLFLMFDGAFDIDLASFAKGLVNSLNITVFNFLVSYFTISGLLILFGFEFSTSIILGGVLGGISSAFVIPIINKIKVSKETYTTLIFESAFTDILCILFALTALEIFTLDTFNLRIIISKVVTTFAVAGIIGIIAGIIWIALVTKIFKEHKSYMITIAYLLLIYVITEYLNGNGAIAALFFGIILKNSKDLKELYQSILTKEENNNSKLYNKVSMFTSVTTPTEEFFYHQISFFLKTFFFVYIGLLIDISNTKLLLVGATIAASIVLVRRTCSILTKNLPKFDREIINSTFGRGLAAAVLAQYVSQFNIPGAPLVSQIATNVIVFSIIFSSITVFITIGRSKDINAVNQN